MCEIWCKVKKLLPFTKNVWEIILIFAMIFHSENEENRHFYC